MTLIHSRGSLTLSSSSPSSLTSRLEIPKLFWLSRVGLESSLFGGSVSLNAKLVCRLKPDFPLCIRPPLILPSSVLSMDLSDSPSPSTITTPLSFFHIFATSSSTPSASPSSRHPEPQCRPMKVASAASAEEVRVRLCFLVKVRNASGRRVGGGSKMGRIVVGLSCGGGIGAVRLTLMGWTGVPKAGDEEGIGLLLARWEVGRFMFADFAVIGRVAVSHNSQSSKFEVQSAPLP
jgi:hypothetical protein